MATPGNQCKTIIIRVMETGVESDTRSISVCDREICALSIIKIGGMAGFPRSRWVRFYSRIQSDIVRAKVSQNRLRESLHITVFTLVLLKGFRHQLSLHRL